MSMMTEKEIKDLHTAVKAVETYMFSIAKARNIPVGDLAIGLIAVITSGIRQQVGEEAIHGIIDGLMIVTDYKESN